MTAPDNLAHEVATVEFAPVEVREPSDIPDLLAEIAERRRSQAASYGAYMIHGVEKGQFGRLGQQVANSYPGGYKLIASRFPASGGDRGLHVDTGMLNEVTAHHTQVGGAEFAMLIGSSLHNVRSLTTGEQVRLRDDLLTRNQRRVKEVSEPDLALRTTLVCGDLLLFDHSQPHVFLTTGKARVSFGYYCELPPLSHSLLG